MMKKNNTPAISVILPIYQVEQYLNQCLDSILRQSFEDYEMILVDDGSVDSSGKIVDEYARKDERITVIHQTNQGLSAARNSGLDIAKGKYITVIDSDDVLLSRDYLKILYDSIIRNNAQISMCNLTSFIDGGIVEDIESEPVEFMICNGVDYWKRKASPAGFFQGCAFAKMYDSKLFENVRYPVGRYVEDQAVIHRLVLPTEKIVILDYPMYGYRLRKTGIMGSTNRHRMIQDLIYAFEDRRSYFLQNNHPDLAELAQLEMLGHINMHKVVL